jgi:hypothetical protein
VAERATRVGRGGEVDVGGDRGHRATAAGEGGAEQFADGAVAAVAGGEERGTDRPVAERGRDPVVVLRERGQGAAPPDDGTQLAQPRLEDRRQPVLRHQQAVGVAGTPRPGVEGHRQAGEVPTRAVARDLVGAGGVEQTAHRQHLGRPRVDPAAAGLRARLAVPLDDGDVGPGEGQLGCEHEAGGPSADDENGSVHETTIPSAELHQV